MSGPVDVRKDLNSIASLLEQLRQNNAAIMLDRVSAAVAELIEAAREATEEKLHNGASSKAACDRLVAALTNVGSAS